MRKRSPSGGRHRAALLPLIVGGALALAACGSSSSSSSSSASAPASSGTSSAAATSASTTAAAKTSCPVRVLLVDNFTGPGSSNGTANIAGAKLAIKSVNASGGVLGCPIALTTVDDGSNYAKDLPLMEAALSKQHYAMAWNGDFGCVTTAPLLEREHLLSISGCAQTNFATSAMPTVFDVTPVTGRESEIAAQFGATQGCKKWALIVDNSELGKDDQESMAAEIKAEGGTVTDAENGLAEGAVDFSSAILRAKASNPQCLFDDMFGASAAHLLHDVAVAGWKIPSYGGGDLAASAMKGLVPLSQVGNYVVGPATMANPSTAVRQQFINGLKASGVTINNFLFGYANGHDPITLFAWGANQTHSLDSSTIATKLHASGSVPIPGLVQGSTTGYTPTCGEWNPSQGFAIMKAGYYNEGRLALVKYASAPLPLPSNLGGC